MCDVVIQHVSCYLLSTGTYGTHCRNMTVSATSCVVSTKYSILFLSGCVLYARVISSFRACVLVCPADLPPARAYGRATRWLGSCRKSVRSMSYTASPYMRTRVGCGHVGTGAVDVPSMSYETAVQKYVCLYESYEYRNCSR